MHLYGPELTFRHDCTYRPFIVCIGIAATPYKYIILLPCLHFLDPTPCVLQLLYICLDLTALDIL